MELKSLLDVCLKINWKLMVQKINERLILRKQLD